MPFFGRQTAYNRFLSASEKGVREILLQYLFWGAVHRKLLYFFFLGLEDTKLFPKS
jgi:hypothetical protein